MTAQKENAIPLVNKKILSVCIILIFIGIVFIVISSQSKGISSTDKISGNVSPPQDVIAFTYKNEKTQETINIVKKDLIFNVKITYDQNNNPTYLSIQKRPELSDFYKTVELTNASDAVFIYPLFTQGAYQENGFYSYYAKKCGLGCLTLPIPSKFVPTYASSMTLSTILPILNYSSVTDVQVDKNPDILKKYRKVIVLHNEYVTKREFDAITSHPNVIYLFPNSLYGEVRADYANNTFTLINGHGYPTPSATNGFDWKFDNSNLEYDVSCENMTFNTISNGKMLNCYPAYRGLFDKSFLEMIKKS